MNKARVYLHEARAPFKRVAEFDTASAVKRGFILMDATDGGFAVVPTDSAFDVFGQGELLALGNLIVIESGYLPPWIGFIESALWDDEQPAISIEVKDAVRLLAETDTPKSMSFTGSAGAAFSEFFREALLRRPELPIKPEEDPEPGPPVAMSFNSTDLLACLNELADTVGMEWWVDFAVKASGVGMTARWASARGRDLSNQVILREGASLLGGSYKLDAKSIAASVRVVGGSAGGGGFATASAGRVLVEGIGIQRTGDEALQAASDSQTSRISPYLNAATARNITLVRKTVTDQGTLLRRAANSLDRRYRGPEVVTAKIGIDDPLLGEFDVGDVVGIESSRLGPSGISKAVRISQMDPDEDKRIVTLKGRVDGGALRRGGLVGVIRQLQDDVRDLQRS